MAEKALTAIRHQLDEAAFAEAWEQGRSLTADASLTVNVTPRARCSIQVIYDTVVSSAKGLGRKIGGRITWRWRVGTSTHQGRWPIIVDCGRSGKLRMKIRVLAR